MATSTLKSDGTGDYVSMIAWESAKQGTLSEPEILECYRGTTVEGNWQADGSLQESVTIAGWTTDATNFITVRAAAGNAHGGVLNSGFWMKSQQNFGAILAVDQQYTIVQDIEVENTAVATSTDSFGFSRTAYVEFHRCIATTSSRGSGFYPLSSTGSTQYVNCLAIGASGAGGSGFGRRQGFVGGSYLHTVAYNCTSIGADYGFTTGSASGTGGICVNCVSVATTQDFYDTNWDTTNSKNNASGDTTAPGTVGAVNGVVLTDGVDFVEPSTGNYNIVQGGKLDGVGADLSGTFTDDITGATRTQWDIGAYGIISSGSFADTNAFTITIGAGGRRKVNVLVGGVWKQAEASVLIGGAWKDAEASVLIGGAWEDVDA